MADYATNVIWHDTRLEGGTPRLITSKVVMSDEDSGLVSKVAEICEYARFVKGLYRLNILCHGFENYIEDDMDQESHMVCGYGLAMTKDKLNLDTVGLLSDLNGLVQFVVIYACGASYTHPQNAGGRGDGRAFIRRMGDVTGAYIIASDYRQWPKATLPYIDMGNWEGNVNGFDTDGSVTAMGKDDWPLE